MNTQILQMVKITAILFLSVFVPSLAVSQTIDSFFIAGIHPAASLQSSATGKQLMTLFPWKGKLLSGFGDYGANTGPINIYSFNPDSLTFKFEVQANSDAITNFRAINGILYAPAIDRKSYGIPGDYIKMDSSGVWANYNLGSNSTHAFDAARFNDSTLFMTGSQDENAAVWKSTNNGRTWKKILTDTAITGNPNDFARFYFAGVYNGKLYVQARDYYGPLHPNSKIYDGISWTSGPSLFPSTNPLGWKPEVFAGKLVYRAWEPGSFSQLFTFDGTNKIWTGLYVFDCFMDANYYYALVDSGFGVKNLRRTTDLVNWENLLAVPAKSRSLAILNDKLFIGTIDSKILQYTKSVSLLTTSIQTLKQDELQLTIYPNPATDFIQLNFFKHNDNFEADIINIHGEIVFKIKNETNVNVSELSDGIYFLEIKHGNNFIVHKLIKQ